MEFVTLPGQSEEFHAQLNELATSSEPILAAGGKMLMELVEHLQSLGPIPKAGAVLVRNELWISPIHSKRLVRVWTDWHDFGEVRNGLPIMHYRLQIRTRGVELTDDVRAATIAEAANAILS